MWVARSNLQSTFTSVMCNAYNSFHHPAISSRTINKCPCLKVLFLVTAGLHGIIFPLQAQYEDRQTGDELFQVQDQEPLFLGHLYFKGNKVTRR